MQSITKAMIGSIAVLLTATAMPAAALQIVTEEYAPFNFTENGKLSLDGLPVPIDEDRSVLINFAGPPGTFDRVSLADVIDREPQEREVAEVDVIRRRGVCLQVASARGVAIGVVDRSQEPEQRDPSAREGIGTFRDGLGDPDGGQHAHPGQRGQ